MTSPRSHSARVRLRFAAPLRSWVALTVVLPAFYACVARAPRPTTPADPDARVIERANSYPNQELRMRGLGALSVAVRSVEHPTDVLSQAVVSLHNDSTKFSQRIPVDVHGVAQFDTLAAGSYQLFAYSASRGTLVLTVRVLSGCRTEVEMYVSVQPVGAKSGAPMPARNAITTCPSPR